MSTHNLCFEQKYEKYQNFLSENFHFLVVKCSVYLYRCVFIVRNIFSLFQSPMMFTSVQDDVCMIMKFLSNSPVTHVAANTHPAVPSPAVTTITCNHNFAVNRWNPNYQRKNNT